jgi:hypothetical protein
VMIFHLFVDSQQAVHSLVSLFRGRGRGGAGSSRLVSRLRKAALRRLMLRVIIFLGKALALSILRVIRAAKDEVGEGGRGSRSVFPDSLLSLLFTL